MSFSRALALSFGFVSVGSVAAPAPVAEYDFNGTLSSSVAGAPILTVTDPLNQSSFVTDAVNGHSRSVWHVGGTADPVLDQGGLTLSTNGLITNGTIYSLEIVLKFTDRDNAWRRIADVQSRTSDNGFYVDPSNNLNVYPVAGGSAFSNNTYHDVFLVNDAGTVTFYLDGSAQQSVKTDVMNLDASKTINFFLDNTQGGGQGEWSAGDIAEIRLYDAALSAVPPPPVPSIPEPQTYVMMLLGLGVVGYATRRRT